MNDMSYSDAGDRWLVAPGDIWTVGPHVLACGDVERGAAGELIQRYGIPDMVYTDPPWNVGLAKSFRRAAALTTGVDFWALMDRTIEAVQLCPGAVLVEMGVKNAPELARRVAASGGREVSRWGITYYRKHPAVLHLFQWGAQRLPSEQFEGIDDAKTPAQAIAAYCGYGWVFDPFLGRGATCLAAYEYGRRCLGLELNARRLAVALDHLAKRGLSPRRVGTLKTMEAT